MALEQEPFIKYNLDSSTDSFTVRLNPEERLQLNIDKKLIKQPKDSTALKQLASIGSKVIHDQKIEEYIKIILENDRKNKRLGINEIE